MNADSDLKRPDLTDPHEEQVDTPTLWTLGGLSIWALARRTISQYRSNRFDASSAQFAYYALLSLAPLLIVVIAIVASSPASNNTLDRVLQTLKAGLPLNAYELIHEEIVDLRQRTNPGLVVIGLGLLLVSGSRLFFTLGSAMRAAYNIDRRIKSIELIFKALLMTCGGFLLLLVAILLLVVGPNIADWVRQFPSTAWLQVLLTSGMRWSVATGAMFVAASTIYSTVPGLHVRFHWVSPGSLFASLSWIAVTQLLRLYVENFGRYNQTYGALAGVVVLLIWLYITGSILLIGGQINGVIYSRITHRD